MLRIYAMNRWCAVARTYKWNIKFGVSALHTASPIFLCWLLLANNNSCGGRRSTSNSSNGNGITAYCNGCLLELPVGLIPQLVFLLHILFKYIVSPTPMPNPPCLCAWGCEFISAGTACSADSAFLWRFIPVIRICICKWPSIKFQFPVEMQLNFFHHV